jgi:hypothetical protein
MNGGSKGGSQRYAANADIKISGEDDVTAKISIDYSKYDFVKYAGTECCWFNIKGCTREGAYSKDDIVRTEITAQQTRKLDVGVGKIHISGNSFSFDFSIAEIPGKGNTHYINKRTAECSKQKPVNDARDQPETRDYTIVIEGAGAIDPQNPDVISGSKTDGNKTITWNLKRCR